MNRPIIEALKELGRVIILSIIPVLIHSLESGDVDWKLLATISSIAALRAVDKWLHETGKERLDSKLTKGITRF